MIIISLSQDLEDNPNLVIIDCINHLAIFSCQPTGKVPAPVKASHHHLSKAFQHVWNLPVEKKIPWLWGVLRAPHCMFEGGNFVKPESDTCDQHPLKTLQPHKLCDSVAEPSLPTSVRFIYYFVFEETVCNFAFAYYNLHFVCAQEKADLAVPAWNLLLKKKHCFCMVLVLSLLALLGWCNL